MRLIFAGTPEFAQPTLQALLQAGHEVALVLTQPDRPSGRGMQMTPSPVKRLALQHGLTLAQPTTLRDAQAQALIASVQADAGVVVAYGLLLPQVVLDMPRHGWWNVHASLLPRWRGAAPIQRAIEAGDAETGVCVMRMEAGLDTGPVAQVHRQQCPILPTDTSASLQPRLAAMGAQAMRDALHDLAKGTLALTPQPIEGVTYASKIDSAQAWARFDDAEALERRMRAFDPAPGVRARLGDRPVKLWQAHALPERNAPSAPHSSLPPIRPGTILETGSQAIVVACEKGSIALTQLQPAGARRQSCAEFLRGHPVQVGMRFEWGEG